MHRIVTRSLASGLAVAALVTLAACGSDGNDTAGGQVAATTTTEAPAEGASTTAAPTTTAAATTTSAAGPTTTTTPKGTEVSIKGFAFTPAVIRASVGDTLRWTNRDSATHSVKARDGSFSSSNLDTGSTFTFTFTTAGTYDYICGIHNSMTGTIQVS